MEFGIDVFEDIETLVLSLSWPTRGVSLLRLSWKLSYIPRRVKLVDLFWRNVSYRYYITLSLRPRVFVTGLISQLTTRLSLLAAKVHTTTFNCTTITARR